MSQADAALMDRAAFAFAAFGGKRVAVAVSGGGDSMALLHLMWRAGLPVAAVTVDHGLRKAAADEARSVAAFCNHLGVGHVTLRWDGPQDSGNLMDQARRARIALIGAWARAAGIDHVALGHTADDQAESFLMNLGRAAGIEGLSGMRLDWQEDGICWTRPLLGVQREELRAYLRRNDIAWIDDPTNEDRHFLRVRVRQRLASLADIGITTETIAAAVDHLAEARLVVKAATEKAASDIVMEQAGGLVMDQPAFQALIPELRRRIVIAALLWFSGGGYAPREAQVHTLLTALSEGRAATLQGCRFRHKGGKIHICREWKAVASLRAMPDAIWDNRWRVNAPVVEGVHVGALGPEGLRQCLDWRGLGIPRDTLLVSPAIWQGDRLISAPLAGFAQGWTATLTAPFGLFILSH